MSSTSTSKKIDTKIPKSIDKFIEGETRRRGISSRELIIDALKTYAGLHSIGHSITASSTN